MSLYQKAKFKKRGMKWPIMMLHLNFLHNGKEFYKICKICNKIIML